MQVEVTGKEEDQKGIIYKLEVQGKSISILFLHHAVERMKKWKLREKMVGETLTDPEEVLLGHNNRFIAHRRYGEHIVRAVYEYKNELPVLVTVYFPYSEKYFKGGKKYEDKIFSGS